MLNINGIEVETDKDGYLLHSLQWNEDVAQAIAQLESIELTDAHWEVIYFVRDFYQEYNTSPAIRMRERHKRSREETEVEITENQEAEMDIE